MALDGPPVAAPNATAEHAEAGGDFDAALAAAIGDDSEQGVTTDAEQAEDVNAPKPVAGKTADAAEGEEDKADEKPVEAAKPKDEKAKPEDDDGIKLRSGFKALARDRAKIREREAAATAKEAAAQQYAAKAQAFDDVRRRIHEDPVGLIREAGGDELLNKLLDGIVASEKSPAEREVAKMRAELERRDQDAKNAQLTAQIETWKSNVRAEVTAQADTFDLVNSLGQHDAVIATIEAYYTTYNGVILDVATAAQSVEDVLAKGLSKSKKFGAREPVKTTQPVNGKTAPAKRGTTLSSVHSSELPSGDGDDLPLDDPNERFRRVMAGIG